MFVNGKKFTSIWQDENDHGIVCVLDQRLLPHEIKVVSLRTCKDATIAIHDMIVRGAPLIGVTAAWGVYLALLEKYKEKKDDSFFENCVHELLESRPTAVNLSWAVEKMKNEIKKFSSDEEKLNAAELLAKKITDEDILNCKKIGEAGLPILREISERKKGAPVNIMTHCNAGWLACVDYGTATSPMYLAHEAGIPIHVWVSETRPRLQGALTSWELSMQGIPNTVFADNAAGHLMQSGKVDVVIVGSDRTAANGDAANKIGTYLKALAAKENSIPFYVALPLSTFDLNIASGKEIPIEERSQDEILFVEGIEKNEIHKVNIFHESAKAINFGFDVTPAKFITGLITEVGVISADEKSIREVLDKKSLS